jgi:ferredoxin
MSVKKRSLARLVVDAGLCAGCGYCRLNCPAEAIALELGTARIRANCTRCARCLFACPVGAIRQQDETKK